MGVRTTGIFFILFLGNTFSIISQSLGATENQVSSENFLDQQGVFEFFLINDPSIYYFEIGLFFGFVLILLVYAFLIYLNVKQRLFLWFFIYTLAISVLLVISDDYLFNVRSTGLRYFKFLNAVIVFLAFKNFFQWVLESKTLYPSPHQWMNIGFFIELLFSGLQLIYPESVSITVLSRVVLVAVISIVIYCVFIDSELSTLQKQFLKISLFALLLSGLSLSIAHIKIDGSSVFLVLGFVFMVGHIFSYSIAVLFRIKKLNDKNESLWQEIRQSKNNFLQSYLNGMEEEKNRISQELQLFVISEMEGLTASLVHSDKVIKKDLAQLIDDIKLVTSELTATNIKSNSGLVQNIEKLVSTRNNGEVTIRFTHFNYSSSLLKSNENHLFRIVQEAIQNIEKYAKATYVEIQIYENENEFLLTIEDDGVGFDSKKKADGIGILNMKNRVSEMGGSFNLASSTGKGVSILIALKIIHE
ncbi:MAG: signal transduction histidine kinase [Halieaceae bacterium]|jgi:signal transduction histidine kinase